MDRRYLAATLALTATFAMFSGEFCTRYLSKVPHSPAELKAEIACAKRYVAKQLVAMLEPYAGQRVEEQAPVLADLSIPELPEAPAAPVAAEPPAGAKCPARPLAHKAPQQVIRMRVMTGDAGHAMKDLSVVRAELLSDRAQEWQAVSNQRAIEINMKAIEDSQRVSARAMEKAQREIRKSQIKMNVPATPGTAMHINFVAPSVAVAPEPPAPSVF